LDIVLHLFLCCDLAAYATIDVGRKVNLGSRQPIGGKCRHSVYLPLHVDKDLLVLQHGPSIECASTVVHLHNDVCMLARFVQKGIQIDLT